MQLQTQRNTAASLGMHPHTVTAQWLVTQQRETDVSMNKPKAHLKWKRKHKPVCTARVPSDSSCKTTGDIHLTFLLWSFLHTTGNWRSPDHTFNQFKEEVTRCSCLQNHKHALSLLYWPNCPVPGLGSSLCSSPQGCKDHIPPFPLHISKTQLWIWQCSSTFSLYNSTVKDQLQAT